MPHNITLLQKLPQQEALLQGANFKNQPLTDVKMGDMPSVSVSKIKELLERRQSNRPKFVRQKNAFGKVAYIVQELNSTIFAPNHE